MTSVASPTPPSNFLRTIIDNDLANNRYADKRWAGQPGPAAIQEQGKIDTARIRTRFPPEPNGYLHIGHAKSI
ncbi:MAG: glutamate--tRNA ligase family protein, partial [Burkholderiaceae bacterium]